MFSFTPVGYIQSCFREKFGIPRQPGLAPAARATLELVPPYARAEMVRGLEGYSHVWLLFVFHGVPAGRWQPMVRPPRLGGNRRLGVFATRSTFRPNPLGLSVVALDGIGSHAGRVLLHLSGVDLLDGTPVLDIKPYLPYADSLPEARSALAPDAPSWRPVHFSAAAAAFCARQPEGAALRELIEQVLRQGPQPAYQHAATARRYGMRLYDCDVRWELRDDGAWVMDIVPATDQAGNRQNPQKA